MDLDLDLYLGRYAVASIGSRRHPNARAIEDLDSGEVVIYLDDYALEDDISSTADEAFEELLRLANKGARLEKAGY